MNLLLRAVVGRACLSLPIINWLYFRLFGAVWGLLLRQLMLAMLLLACLCLILVIWGSLGLAIAATYVSHACPYPSLFNFILPYFCFIWGSFGLCNACPCPSLLLLLSLVVLFYYWGGYGTCGYNQWLFYPCPFITMLTVLLSMSLGR